MPRTINVAPGEMMPIDFKSCDVAATYDIESCIAVATLDNEQNSGTLSHMRLTDPSKFLFMFLRGNASLDSKVYIVGGWKATQGTENSAEAPKSEDYLDQIKAGMISHGYNITNEHVLSPIGSGCHLFLRPKKSPEVHLYRRMRNPEGMQQIHQGSFLLE